MNEREKRIAFFNFQRGESDRLNNRTPLKVDRFNINYSKGFHNTFESQLTFGHNGYEPKNAFLKNDLFKKKY